MSNYKEEIEDIQHIKYSELLKNIVSKDDNEIPYIFYVSPDTTNVENYYFDKCIYGFFQITIGADGYLYKCSSTAAPNALNHRLGKVTSNMQEFVNAILQNYDETWNCKIECFEKGLRCNRMGIEVNQEYSRRDELLRVLKRDYGIDDLQAAIREAKNIDEKVVKRNVRIESEFQKLTERYEI